MGFKMSDAVTKKPNFIRFELSWICLQMKMQSKPKTADVYSLAAGLYVAPGLNKFVHMDDQVHPIFF